MTDAEKVQLLKQALRDIHSICVSNANYIRNTIESIARCAVERVDKANSNLT